MLAFLVLVLIMGVILASTFLSFIIIDEKEKEIQQLSVISSLSLSFNVENFNTQLEVWEYLYDPNEFRLEEFREHREDFNVKLHSLFEAIEQSNIILTPENKQIVHELKRDIPTVQENWETLVNAIESGKSDQEIRQIAFEVENFFQESAFNYNIEKFSKFHYERLKEMQNEIEDLLVVTKLRGLLLGIISLIVGISFAFVMSRSISVPIKKLTKITQEIAQGKLYKKVAGRSNDAAISIGSGNWDTNVLVSGNDEIRDLSQSFNEMSKYLKKYQEEIIRRTLAEEHSLTLEKIEKQKDEFIAMISHELRAPLTPIKIYATTLKRPKGFGELNQKQMDAVDSIHFNAVRLERLIEDLLDAQRLDTGRMTFLKEKFSVNEFVDAAVKDYQIITQETNIQISSKIDEEISLFSDKKRLDQVLTNLARNSMDFVPKDTGTIQILVEQFPDEVLFTVKDNGIGISKEEQKELFTKFYQVDTSITRKHGGTGLGLAICKGIVEGLGGKIWLESEEGKGTNVYFTIPRDELQ